MLDGGLTEIEFDARDVPLDDLNETTLNERP
jgi:hypothetical protein